MSVLRCDRSGCENIMCDLMIFSHYSCNECANQFRELVGSEEMPKLKLEDSFSAFMETPKEKQKSNDMTTVDAFLQAGG